MTSKRKPLADSVEKDFIKGDTAAKEAKPRQRRRKSTQGSKLQNIADLIGDDDEGQVTVRITADIPKSLHRRLRQCATDLNTTQTAVVMKLLDEYLPS